MPLTFLLCHIVVGGENWLECYSSGFTAFCICPYTVEPLLQKIWNLVTGPITNSYYYIIIIIIFFFRT